MSLKIKGKDSVAPVAESLFRATNFKLTHSKKLSEKRANQLKVPVKLLGGF